MVFLTLLFLPMLIALAFLVLGQKRVHLYEFLTQMVAMSLFVGICMLVIYRSNTGDTEYINGVVTKKLSEKVSCRHPYCCSWCESCTTDSEGRTSCTTYCCRTCYDHPYDVDWNVYSNAGANWSIATIDRQGLKEPPRWTSTAIGESVSWVHDYENYVKAAPGSLFKRDVRSDEKSFTLPDYRPAVFDYWKANRVYTVGLTLPKDWNDHVSYLNGQLGPKKGVNFVLVVVKDQRREYFEALSSKWLGGKKNDVVLVIGVDGESKITWADVMAWSYNQMVRVGLRDDVKAVGTLNRDSIMNAVERNIFVNYDRQSMSDYQYLKSSFSPTGKQYLASIIIGCIISLAIGFYFYHYDPFEQETGRQFHTISSKYRSL